MSPALIRFGMGGGMLAADLMVKLLVVLFGLGAATREG